MHPLNNQHEFLEYRSRIDFQPVSELQLMIRNSPILQILKQTGSQQTHNFRDPATSASEPDSGFQTKSVGINAAREKENG